MKVAERSTLTGGLEGAARDLGVARPPEQAVGLGLGGRVSSFRRRHPMSLPGQFQFQPTTRGNSASFAPSVQAFLTANTVTSSAIGPSENSAAASTNSLHNTEGARSAFLRIMAANRSSPKNFSPARASARPSVNITTTSFGEIASSRDQILRPTLHHQQWSRGSQRMDLSISHKPRCRMASGGVAQRLGMLVKNNYAQRNELLGAFEETN